jgi:hypothetical protein
MTGPTMRRCKGSLHPGRRAPFGRVVCPLCLARLRPLAGGRVPNHKADVAAKPREGGDVSAGGPPRGARR